MGSNPIAANNDIQSAKYIVYVSCERNTFVYGNSVIVNCLAPNVMISSNRGHAKCYYLAASLAQWQSTSLVTTPSRQLVVMSSILIGGTMTFFFSRVLVFKECIECLWGKDWKVNSHKADERGDMLATSSRWWLDTPDTSGLLLKTMIG